MAATASNFLSAEEQPKIFGQADSSTMLLNIDLSAIVRYLFSNLKPCSTYSDKIQHGKLCGKGRVCRGQPHH